MGPFQNLAIFLAPLKLSLLFTKSIIKIYSQCSTYKMSFTPDPAWFNGDYALIVGQCECPQDMDWDDSELTCYVSISVHCTLYSLFVI